MDEGCLNDYWGEFVRPLKEGMETLFLGSIQVQAIVFQQFIYTTGLEGTHAGRESPGTGRPRMCYQDMRELTNQSDTVESGILGPSKPSDVGAGFVSRCTLL